MALLLFEKAFLSFGHVSLLDATDLNLQKRERVALVGRNGAGKSSVLKVISGEYQLDDGVYWQSANLKVSYLAQDLTEDDNKTVFEIVSEGIPEVSLLLTEYHHLIHQVADSQTQSDIEQLALLQTKIEAVNGWKFEQQIAQSISKLNLNSNDSIKEMSGGQKRRVYLAKALVGDPDILLLDEPTNHLDISSILWLEKFLLELNCSVLFITHDRSFLSNLATRIIDLDRGQLISYPGDYATYLKLKAKHLEEEIAQNKLFDKKLSAEETWIRQGIKARRTRNEGRVRALEALRQTRVERREKQGNVKLTLSKTERSGKLVVEFENVNFSYHDKCLVKNLSLCIQRGDRIGIIGPNGVGKSSLLKLLLNEIKPDSGTIRLGTKLQIAYFDQHREQLDINATVFDNVNNGQEYVEIQGQSRHVIGYLQDFLFSPERIRSPVRSLSGGERNRLLLARLFTEPANLLILDEPTNDLDIETLELLENLLLNYQGTILLVSHDRQFLDNIVTSTLVLSGEGEMEEYVGGYLDYLRQSKSKPSTIMPPKIENKKNLKYVAIETSNKKTKTKLSYKEQYELENITKKIEQLEKQQMELQTQFSDSNFYTQDSNTIVDMQVKMKTITEELEVTYSRWEELDNV